MCIGRFLIFALVLEDSGIFGNSCLAVLPI